MIDLTEVLSVTEFQRNIKSYAGRLRTPRTPLDLTVNGRGALVVQDAASCQRMLGGLEEAHKHNAIREGLKQFKQGQAIPLTAVERPLRKKHGFLR